MAVQREFKKKYF